MECYMVRDFFNSVAGVASILVLILAVAGWWINRDNNRLLREGDARTNAILLDLRAASAAAEAQHQALLERLDTRAAQAHQEMLQVLDRMDQRAEERHRVER